METTTENLWKEFEVHLRWHDWFNDFSDDHRTWEKGNRSYNHLTEKFDKLMLIDPVKTVETWNKYAPKQFRKNVG